MRVIPLAFAATLLVGAGCATNPATGEKQFNLVSEEQEIELGQQAAPEAIKQFGGLYKNEEAQRFVSGIGMKLAAASARPKLPWSYQVVNAPEPNAFALPGGPIFITVGLLSRLENEAELAAVLGHETGHVAARHQAQQISKSAALQAVLGVGAAVAGEGKGGQAAATGATIAGELLLLKYSRDMESQADQLGMDYGAKAGWDPHGMPDLLAVLLKTEKELGGGGGLPTFLQTHPATEERVEAANDYIAEKFKGKTEGLKQDSEMFASLIAPIQPPPPSARTGREVPAGTGQPEDKGEQPAVRGGLRRRR